MSARLLSLMLLFVIPLGCSCEDEKEKRFKRFILDEAPKIQHPLRVEFDDKIELLGYKLSPSGPVRPNQKLKVTFYWRPKAQLEDGWTVLTHLLDASGERLLTLDDRGTLRKFEDGERRVPVSSWKVGKIYADRVDFRIPKTIKTDTLELVVGFYKDDERLAVRAGNKDSQERARVVTLRIDRSKKKKKKGSEAALPLVKLDKLPVDAQITIDGKLDEAAWQKAPVLGPFVDVARGGPNRNFPVNGKARMAWNDQALFVGFEVEDPDVLGGFPAGEPDPKLWTRDTVELMIDPDGDGDNRDYYEIQINPQNLVFDSRFDRYNQPKVEPNGPFGHQDWSSNLKSAVVVDGTLDRSDDRDRGYVVEAMIPWTSFGKARRAPPAPGDTWRMNLYAMQSNSGVAWSPILGQGNFHKAARFGRVTFVERSAESDAGVAKRSGKAAQSR